MKLKPILLLALLSSLIACRPAASTDAGTMNTDNPATALVQEMIQTMGGLDRWHALQDLEYTYTYRNPASGKQDVSLERYVYDGELSWARYDEHSQSLMPEQAGEIIQGFDGQNAWMTYEGELMTDPQYTNRAMFSRKTNFYWLNMMYKLLDPGVQHEMLEDQDRNGTTYHRVKVTFGDSVGDAQDTYVLYINPQTKLVDYFLFTVMAFNRSAPLFMEVKYGEVDGLKFPVERRYAPSDWEGNVNEGANWMEALSGDIKLNTGIDHSIFRKPM
ncbi:MAG: DUF6503 family protein [Saprospiraceae bacterium]|nr:hypothetical protein [Lewinella sp.]